MADFTEVQWAPPSTSTGNNGHDDGAIIHEHLLLSLQSAASAAQEFNDRFHVRDSARESSVPLFMGDELVLGREPIRTCGYYAEYELKAVRVLMDLVGDGGNFAPAVQVKRQAVLAKSAQGALSVKYLQAGLLESFHGPGAAADMITEIRILMNMAPHANVAEIYGINQGGIDTLLEKGRKGFFMITDCMTETLNERMCLWREKLGYDPNSCMTRFNQRMQAALQVASALVHLHDHEIVYHLRPDKVGYDKQDGLIKLYNFSQARQDGTKDHSRSITSSDDIRTLAYTAPEVLCMAPVTTSADVYSFGILLWETMSLRHPYDRCDRATHFEQAVQQHKRPPVNRQWPEHLRQLLEACWHPHMRLSMKRVHQTLESALLLSAQLCAQQQQASSCSVVTTPCSSANITTSTRNPNRITAVGASAVYRSKSPVARRKVPPSPGGRGRQNIGLGSSIHSEQTIHSRISTGPHRTVPASPGGRGRKNNGTSTSTRGEGSRSHSRSHSRSRSRSRSSSRSGSREFNQQHAMKPIPNLLGNSSHHQSDDDQEFLVGFEKSQGTATTVEDGNSSNCSSTELSSTRIQSDQQRRGGKVTPRANSFRNVRGNVDHPERPKTPTRVGRRGMLQMDDATAMRSVALTQSKTLKTPKTPGQPVRRGLLQKVGGSMRDVLTGHDEGSEQAKMAPTTSSRLLLKNTSGSMRNLFTSRSQPGGADTAAPEQAPISPRKVGPRRPTCQENTPATPGGSRPLKIFNKNISACPSRNITTSAEPRTLQPLRSMMSKQLSLRKQHSARSLSPSREIVEPRTPKKSLLQKIGSFRNILGSSSKKSSHGADSSGHDLTFDPHSVELSPKPEPRLTTKPTGASNRKGLKPSVEAPSSPVKGGVKAPLTVMCPSPTPKRLGFSSVGSVNENGSVCGSASGSVQGEESRAAAIAARKNVKQQLAAIKHSLAPIQSPFKNSRMIENPLLFPPTPDQSVSKTIKSTNSSQDMSVFDKLLGPQNHDSFGFDDSGWNMDMISDDEETEINPSPCPVPADPETKPGGEALAMLGDALTMLVALPGVTVGKDTGDQSSNISCLTESSECPATPSRQVTLRKSTSARSVLAPPPLDVEGCY